MWCFLTSREPCVIEFCVYSSQFRQRAWIKIGAAAFPFCKYRWFSDDMSASCRPLSHTSYSTSNDPPLKGTGWFVMNNYPYYHNHQICAIYIYTCARKWIFENVYLNVLQYYQITSHAECLNDPLSLGMCQGHWDCKALASFSGPQGPLPGSGKT